MDFRTFFIIIVTNHTNSSAIKNITINSSQSGHITIIFSFYSIIASVFGLAWSAPYNPADTPESDRSGVMSTASFSANIAIFDALMMGIMEEKDYALSDFALIHPGGAVGKKIN